MSEDFVYLDSGNWKSLKKFGADLSTDLNSSSGTEASDGSWRVVNTGPLKWDIYHPGIQIMEGEGAPLQIELQDQNELNEGTPNFWVLGHNRVRQLSATKVLMKFDSFPKNWPIDQLVAETGNWLREARKGIEAVQAEMQPDLSVPQPPPPGGAPGGGMGMVASRRGRLAWRLVALERDPLETVSTDKSVSDVVDMYPSKSSTTLGVDQLPN